MYLLQAKIKYSYTIELRQHGIKGLNGFLLPVDQIKPTVEEAWEGIQKMSELIAQEYIKGDAHTHNNISI